MITFTTIPSNNRVPGVFPEFAPQTQVGNSLQATLVIAQMLTSGTAVANIPVLCNSASQAATSFGPGSMAHRMVSKYYEHDNSATVYVLPVADSGSGTVATATVTFAGTASSATTHALYIDGDRFAVGVAVGDTPTVIAGKFVTLIATTAALSSFTAANTAGVLTLTYKHAGLCGNDAAIYVNFGGSNAAEVAPVGVTTTVTAFAGGATNPVLTTALGNVGDLPLDFFILPYSDTTSLDAVKLMLQARWAWNYTAYGQAFASIRVANLAGAVAFGTARNDQYTSVMPVAGSPTHPSLWAAAYGAQAAVSIKADAALPIRQVALNVIAPGIADRFNFASRETLLFSGLSTFLVDRSGTVTVEKAVTTYQTSPAGVLDTSYENVERVATLTYVVRALVNDLRQTFGRCVLVGEGDLIPAGSSRINARLVRGHIIGNYASLVERGMASDSAGFVASLVVENQGQGKLAVYWPAVLANQLDQIGIIVAFKAA